MLQVINYSEDMPVKIEAISVENYPMHSHLDIEIIYVIKGEIELKVSFNTYKLKTNNMHIINCKDVHSISGKKNENIIMILHLNLSYFERYFFDIREKIFISYQGSSTTSIVKNLVIKKSIFIIISELLKKEGDYIDKIKDTANKCISDLYENFQYFSIDKNEFCSINKNVVEKYNLERIDKVIASIYRRYSEKLSLAELAEEEHINKYYFSHLIKRIVGVNFRDFLNMVRVESSESILLCGNKSIQSISEDCGFSNAKYYNNSFKKWFGMSPKQYKDKYKKETIVYIEPVYEIMDLNDIYFIENQNEEKEYYKSANKFKIYDIVLDFNKVSDSKFEFFQDCNLYISNPNILMDEFIRKKIEILKNQTEKERCSMTLLPESKFTYYLDSRESNDTNDSIIDIMSDHIKQSKLRKVQEILIDDLSISTKPLFWGCKGIISRNGLLKPPYYAYLFLSELGRTVIQHGDNYIFTKDENNFQLLLFLESQGIAAKDFSIKIHTNQKSYYITEKKLDAKTCMAYDHWLNMRRPQIINSANREMICGSSAPAICYRFLPSDNISNYSVSIKPPGIVLLNFNITV